MLSGDSIIQNINRGLIVIDPFSPEHIGPNSYDLTLGPWIVRLNDWMENDIIDLNNIEHVKDMYTNPVKIDRKIILAPHERILCHTNEFIGTTDKYVMEIASRSTTVRLQQDVCGSGGFGDVGFVNKWTLELHNTSRVSVSLSPGTVIAQAYFTLVTGDITNKYNSNYMRKDYNDWQPEDMLPKALNVVRI